MGVLKFNWFVARPEVKVNYYYYLAGPMRGKKLYNMAEFLRVATKLRDVGYVVKNPMEKDLAGGMDPSKGLEEQGFSMPSAFLWDFKTIADDACWGVILLPGWEKSQGVAAELVLAWHIGREVYEYVEDLGSPCLRLVDLKPPEVTWTRM